MEGSKAYNEPLAFRNYHKKNSVKEKIINVQIEKRRVSLTKPASIRNL